MVIWFNADSSSTVWDEQHNWLHIISYINCKVWDEQQIPQKEWRRLPFPQTSSELRTLQDILQQIKLAKEAMEGYSFCYHASSSRESNLSTNQHVPNGWGHNNQRWSRAKSNGSRESCKFEGPFIHNQRDLHLISISIYDCGSWR